MQRSKAEGRAFNCEVGTPLIYDSIEVRGDGKTRAQGVRLFSTAMASGELSALHASGAAGSSLAGGGI